MKKYRNTCGCLSISTEAAAKLEKEAAERYYCHGQIYFNESDRRTYICQKNPMNSHILSGWTVVSLLSRQKH